MPRIQTTDTRPSPLERSLAAVSAGNRKEAQVDAMVQALSGVSESSLGDWRLVWQQKPRKVIDGRHIMLVHEIEAYLQGVKVFDDRIRQVNHAPYMVRGGDPRDPNRIIRYSLVPDRKGRLHEREHYIENIEAATLVSLINAARVATNDGTQPRIIEGPRGTVSTFPADTTDGSIRSGSAAGAAWDSTRNGVGGLDLNPFGTSVISAGAVDFAAANDYQFHEVFLKFNTAAINTDTISAAVLQLDLQTAYDDNGDLYQIRKTTDWATLASDDYIAGDAFAALTLLSEVDYGAVAGSGYTNFTFTSPDSNIAKTGVTYLVMGTKFFADNTTPTSAQDGGWDWNPTETASTTSDPQLVVTHAAGGGGGLDIPIGMHHYLQMTGTH